MKEIEVLRSNEAAAAPSVLGVLAADGLAVAASCACFFVYFTLFLFQESPFGSELALFIQEQGWANFWTHGPLWVLEFDSWAQLGGDGWRAF